MEVFVALVVCLVPLAAVGGLVVWLVRSGRDDTRARVAGLEQQAHELREKNDALLRRVQHLEAGLGQVYSSELPGLRALVGASSDSVSVRAPAEQVPPRAELVAAPAADTEGMAVQPSAPMESAAMNALVESAPMESAPMGSAPMESASMGSAPMGSAPMGSAPMGSAPMGSAPMESAPMGSAPMGSAPMGSAPMESAPMESAPMESAPMNAPVGAGPIGSAPAGNPPGSSWASMEQWIGVRGAAALGALVLVIAGLYFFQYSIEHGLLSPSLRVVLGVAVGLGCVLGADLRLRRNHPTLAQWLTGAGVAILYVAFWAGRSLYELYPSWAASIAMIATTGACVVLASARRSVVVAALGLFGGFITPLALSTGQDRPIALFGYLLVLDGAMLWLAYRRRWAWLALASLVGTSFYQVGWILARLDEPRLLLGAAILGVFAIGFAAMPRRASDGSNDGSNDGATGEEPALWRATRAGGVLVPLLLAIHVSLRGDLGAHFAVTAPLLLALCAGAAFVGVRQKSRLVPLVAALASLGSVLGAGAPQDSLAAWQLAGLLTGLALVFHAVTELRARTETATHAAAHAAVLGGLAVTLLLGSSTPTLGPAPWTIALLLLVVVGLRQARLWPPLAGWLGVLVGFVAPLVLLTRVGVEHQPAAPVLVGLALLATALVGAVTFFQSASVEHRRHGDLGAAAASLLVLLALPLASRSLEAVPQLFFFGGAMIASALGTMAVWRMRSARGLAVSIVVHTLAIGLWVVRQPVPFDWITWLGVLTPVSTAIAIALARPTPVFADDAWRWRAAALAGPLAFPAARFVHLEVFGAGTVGLVAVLLAAVSSLVLVLAHRRGPRDLETRRTALAWASAATASLVTVAIPVQLDNEWITIGWALEAVALAAIWRRLDHAGLKYFALTLVVAVGIRLLANPYVLHYYPRGDLRILNWLSYTYLVPAVALVGTWSILHAVERPRLRSWEKDAFGERAFVATFTAAAAIGIVFVWVNLTIFDIFASGPALTIPLERMPARDLSVSLAWGVFALGLLGLGMSRRVLALRVTSLVLVLVTSTKVFLYDLAYLRDLYRVASLVGLALALITISFVYQRFVFRETSTPEERS